MTAVYHVTSSVNRASIQTYGLDWRRMGSAPGIAGSDRPEVDGCFLALGEYERRWFVDMNNTGGPVDVWRVEGVDVAALRTSPNGYLFHAGTIAPARLALVQTDIEPGRRRAGSDAADNG
ncbi:hypothetical protein GCM10009624_33120 [Gordonia sinesedis]